MTGRLLRLRVGRSTLTAEAVDRGSVTWRAEVAYGALAELADAIAHLAAEPPRACRRLAVTLERPPAQLRTLTDLPPVKTSHLTTLVGQQAGRFFRKNGHSLVTDAVWVGNGGARVARAAAVDEPLVEAIAAGARAAGLWLESITVEEESAKLVLLPRSEREARERRAHRLTRTLAVTTCALWIVVGGAFFARLAWERRTVARELAALRQPLAAVIDARRALRDAEMTLKAIAQAEEERGQGFAVLAAVTGALPDSSVITSLAWSADGTGAIGGIARHAAGLVARLDRVDALAGVRLGGPVTRESLGGRDWERFTVLFGGDDGKRGGS